MDELDKLKGAWNRSGESSVFNQQDIARMMHRKSRSIVKWIFIISVIELVLGLMLSFGVELDYADKPHWYMFAAKVLDIVYYPVAIYFIYQFFKSYWGLKNTVSVKAHLDAVLRSRHYVELYIKFNIYFLLPSFVINIVEKAIDNSQNETWGYVFFSTVFYAIALLIVYYVIVQVMKWYYRVLYRRLTSKLEHNQEELDSIDE